MSDNERAKFKKLCWNDSWFLSGYNYPCIEVALLTDDGQQRVCQPC